MKVFSNFDSLRYVPKLKKLNIKFLKMTMDKGFDPKFEYLKYIFKVHFTYLYFKYWKIAGNFKKV